MSNPTEHKEGVGGVKAFFEQFFYEDDGETTKEPNAIPSMMLSLSEQSNKSEGKEDTLSPMPVSEEIVETVDATRIIQEAYHELPAEKSVFKIGEIRKNVETLPEEQQRNVILGFLQPMGFVIEDFLLDGQQRSQNLATLLQEFISSSQEQIQTNETLISNLLEQVDELKTANLEAQKNQENTKKVVINEYQKIQAILSFMTQQKAEPQEEKK